MGALHKVSEEGAPLVRRPQASSKVARWVVLGVGVVSCLLLLGCSLVRNEKQLRNIVAPPREGHHHHHHHTDEEDDRDEASSSGSSSGSSPFSRGYHFGWGGSSANLSAAVSLCTEFDDDWYFPSSVCDCGDFWTQCKTNMNRSATYRDLCFDAACGEDNLEGYDGFPADDPVEKCAGLRGPSWGVPCAWQAVLQLPATCAGRFKPEPPFGRSRDEPNKFPDLDSGTRNAVGYLETFAGPCNAHAFCFSCLDDDFFHGVHPYCQAVFATYGATPEATGDVPTPKKNHGQHQWIHNFFDDLDDFWCRDDVLQSLGAFYESERRR